MVAVDETLASAGNQITDLVQKLQSAQARERWRAADGLGRLGRTAGVSVAVPALLRCAEDEDEDVRCAAARALGHVGEDANAANIAPELVRLLEDEDGGVRWGAAEGLGNLGSSASCGMAQLKDALQDEEEDVRGASAQSLGKLVKLGAIPAKEVVPSFIEGLADKEWSVRRSAAEALGRCGAAASECVAVVALRRVAFRDPHPQVKRTAELALEKILGPSEA
mmetsp:Transcript_21210/g.26155  ORF Transcript_21210/g.26155 Transcript_21210/m.26155 type:complete len:223 (-) Transcript_21210:158-826(-)